MKSYKGILILLFFTIGWLQSVEAQWNTYYYGDFYYPMWDNPYYYNLKDKVKDKHIQSQVVIEENYKKGHPVRYDVNRMIKFDRNGNEVEYCNSRGDKKIKYKTISTYDSSNNRTSQITYKKKHIKSDVKAKYNKFNHCIEYKYYTSKGNLKDKVEYDWDSTLELEARIYKKANKLNYKWVFEYYPDKSSKKTTKYNAKGKVKKVWTYDCNLLGDVMKKHDDTIKMCHFDSSDKQGYYYKIDKRSYENGKMYKTISKYSKDSLYLGYSNYDEKNMLRSFSEVTYNSDSVTKIYKYYNKRGKQFQYMIYKMDKQNNIYSSENCWKFKNCDKRKTVSTYLYDKKGILLKITTWHGPQVKYVWDYFYTFY
jgi:hypothetical protein